MLIVGISSSLLKKAIVAIFNKGEATTSCRKSRLFFDKNHASEINDSNPAEAAKKVVDRIKERPIPFHGFRNILKSPTWYLQVHQGIKKRNPKIELLDAPTFFELYRIYLENHPVAAHGK